MANEQAIKDENEMRSLLVADSTKQQTRLLTIGANGGLAVEAVGSQTGMDGAVTVATAGTPVKLKAQATPCREVIIKALTTNTGLIKVGRTSTPAYPLAKGESVALSVADGSTIWVDCTVNGEGAAYIINQ